MLQEQNGQAIQKLYVITATFQLHRNAAEVEKFHPKLRKSISILYIPNCSYKRRVLSAVTRRHQLRLVMQQTNDANKQRESSSKYVNYFCLAKELLKG